MNRHGHTPPGTAPGRRPAALPFNGASPLTSYSWRAPALLGVWAHPDDESYLSAALMRRVIAAGGRVAVVTATRGEGGTSDPRADRTALGRRRASELRAAMAELGVFEVSLLDHPDGGCADVPFADGVAAVERAILTVRPHLVVTFGPDGITGHPDHVAVSDWTTAAWNAVRRSPGTLPEAAQLLYATMTDSFVARHQREYGELPLTLVGPPRSVPDREVAVRVEPDPDERRRKRAALDAHASQTSVLTELLGTERFHQWWQTETFRYPTASEHAASSAATAATAAPAAPATTAERGRAAGRLTTSPDSLQLGSKPRPRHSVTVGP